MRTLEWLQGLYINEFNLVNRYVVEAKEYPMHNLGRSHHGLLYTQRGTEIYHFEDRTVETTPDSVLYIPKGEIYTIELRGEISDVITIDFECKPMEAKRPFLMQLGSDVTLRSCFSDIEAAWRKKEPDHLAICKSKFYLAIASMIRHKVVYSGSATYNKIREAVLYLHEHYLERNFKIDRLSTLSDMSARYFEMLFAGEFKMSPKEYVTHLKLELAKELLLNEKNTVTSIAEQLGFSDIYHFSKTFTQKIGQSPTEYRLGNAQKTGKSKEKI